MKNISTFETGKTYKMTFIGDSELIVPITVIKRTPSFITFKIRNGEHKRAKIDFYRGSEFIYPEGKYSMAPTCYAKRVY